MNSMLRLMELLMDSINRDFAAWENELSSQNNHRLTSAPWTGWYEE